MSYKIVGACFNIFNELGPGLHEKYYQKALAQEFAERKISFTQQFPVKISYKDKFIGNYFLDFLVDKNIIVELKKGERYTPKYIEQVKAYLKTTNMKLAILVYFGNDAVKFKRIINER